MRNKKRLERLFSAALLLALLGLTTGCELTTMDAGEYGVVFKALPPPFGGVDEKVVGPGQTRVKWLWEEIYRMDTTKQRIGWGGLGQGEDTTIADYVETRALDGNEVGLAVEVLYHIEPNRVKHVVQNVGSTNKRISQLVTAVARADIRTHMNILNTKQFFIQQKRNEAVRKVQQAMISRLEPEGIIIDSVIYTDHRFERQGSEGEEPDRSYQQQIDETQAKYQETEREGKRRAALVQEKGREQEVIQAEVNQMVEWAKGFKRQAKTRGDAYLAQKENIAAQIETAGINEVEGMRKRISALSGPGGEALLRLGIAEALTKQNPRFLLLNATKGGNGEVGINKINMNELIDQAGLFAATMEGIKDEPKEQPTKDKDKGRALAPREDAAITNKNSSLATTPVSPPRVPR